MPHNIKELKEFFKVIPTHHTAMLQANHGVGKSSVVKGPIREVIAERHNVDPSEVKVIDMRASQMDPGDLTGGIFLVGGQTYFAPPSWFPVHPDDSEWLSDRLEKAGREWQPFQTNKVGILFLDELNRARPETLQCFFELILDRSLNQIRIPDTWYVISAVNSDRDIYNVEEQDPAFTDRVTLIDFDPSFAEWYEYMEGEVNNKKIHEAIVLFTKAKDNKIDPQADLITKARDRGEKIFSRRSWYRLGEAIMSYENSGYDLIQGAVEDSGDAVNDLIRLASSYVGSAVGLDFVTFVRSEYQQLTPKIILEKFTDKVGDMVSKMAARNAVNLAGLSKAITDELNNSYKGKKLPAAVQKNITKFLQALPREARSGFWSEWRKEDKSQADAWYNTNLRKRVITESMMLEPAFKKWLASEEAKGKDMNSDAPIKK